MLLTEFAFDESSRGAGLSSPASCEDGNRVLRAYVWSSLSTVLLQNLNFLLNSRPRNGDIGNYTSESVGGCRVKQNEWSA